MQDVEQDLDQDFELGVPSISPEILNEVAKMWRDPFAENMESEVEMSSLWQHLPQELQGQVAKHLPAHAILRFRCVAKSWSKPRLQPAATAGLHIRRSMFEDGCLFTLHSGNEFLRPLKFYLFRTLRPFAYRGLGCINGLLAFAVIPADNFSFEIPVHFEILNVFTGCAWTVLRPPHAPGRDPQFVGMSKLPGPGGLPRDVSVEEELGDGYLLVAGMANYVYNSETGTDIGEPVISMLLQVYRAGSWSSSLLTFPLDNSLMRFNTGNARCGVLRGSIFYYLLMNVENKSATLACTDLLSPREHCTITTLCALDREFVHEWNTDNDLHPKLAVCSGKLLIVYGCAVPGKRTSKDRQAYTACIQVLDEERLVWRFESALPEELRWDESFWPRGVSDGGNEVAFSDEVRYESYSYDFVSKVWSRFYSHALSGIHTNKIYFYTG